MTCGLSELKGLYDFRIGGGVQFMIAWAMRKCLPFELCENSIWPDILLRKCLVIGKYYAGESQKLWIGVIIEIYLIIVMYLWKANLAKTQICPNHVKILDCSRGWFFGSIFIFGNEFSSERARFSLVCGLWELNDMPPIEDCESSMSGFVMEKAMTWLFPLSWDTIIYLFQSSNNLYNHTLPLFSISPVLTISCFH